MDSTKGDVSNKSPVIDSRRTTLTQIKEKFAIEKLQIDENMKMSQVLICDYNSIMEKRNPLNEQVFVRIKSDMQEICSYFKAIGPNLKIIEKEIHDMELIIDSSTDSFMQLFLGHEELVLNILEKLGTINTESAKTIKDLLKEFTVLSES